MLPSLGAVDLLRLGESDIDDRRDAAGLCIDPLREIKLTLVSVTNVASGAARGRARWGSNPSSRSCSEKMKRI